MLALHHAAQAVGAENGFELADMSGPRRSPWPPSTLITWPVIQLAASLSKKSAALAMSSTSPGRGNGVHDA